MFDSFDFNSNFGVFLEQTRDRIEEEKMENDAKTVSRLKTLDRAFEKYCKGVTKIPNFQEDRALRESIEEKWAMFLKKAEIKEMQNEEILREADKLISSFVSKPHSHYNPNHSVQRGIRKLCANDKEGAQSLFAEVQKNETNLNCKISGKMLESTNAINLNPQNEGNVKSNIKKLLEVRGLIR